MTISSRGAREIPFKKKMPKALSRAGSVEALYATWRRMQQSVCSPALLAGMPRAIDIVASRIYDVEPHMVAEAIREGDAALFIAVLYRLSLLDAALTAAGRGVADRAPIIYAKHIVDGFKKVADDAFVELGGTPL